MKLTWLTDIHLNFLEPDERADFYRKLHNLEGDALLLTGDIAEAPSVGPILQEMHAAVKKPIYFVLGNHDFYRSNVAAVKNQMTHLTETHPEIIWLPHGDFYILEKNILLLGQDGWADGRLGDYHHSSVSLNDSRYIADLYQQKIVGKQHLLEKMQELADVDAAALENQLEQALQKNPKNIIILTHIPPFKEASWYQDKVSDDEHLPYFTSKAMGDVLIKIAHKNPHIKFLILCGHTHTKAEYQPSYNLLIKVGAAEYYNPQVQEVLDTHGGWFEH